MSDSVNITMDFDLYYQQEILPEVNKFEVLRKNTLYKYILYKTLVILGIVSYFSIIISYYQTNFTSIYILPVSVVFLWCCLVSLRKVNQMQDDFGYLAKTSLYNKIIAFYPNLQYQALQGASEIIVRNSKLFDDFNLFESEDYIFGHYKNIRLELAEIKLKQLTQTISYVNDRTIIETHENEVFHGLFCLSSLNKKFSSTTYVIADRWLKINTNLPSALKRVTLEDPEFEKIFDVYSDNQIEARYLLTPSFIERLIDLNKYKALRCCFIDNQMIIALKMDTEFLPKLKLYSPITYSKVKKLIDEIQIFFTIIDTLKLDLNIGL